MPKYLIINADDFGYNKEQNKAIEELYSQKLISSTSALVVAPFAKEAMQTAAKNNIPVGVHLAINSDNENERWQSISGEKSLSDEKGLYQKQKDIAFKVKREQLRHELEAQYEFIKSSGVEVDHADNHSGTLYGINGRRFFIDAYDFCAKHSLAYRFPKTPGFFERQIGMNIPKPLLSIFKYLVSQGEKRGVKMLDDLVSNPWSIERIGDYETLRKYYLDAIDNCIDGVTEMFLHPAYPISDEINSWTKRAYELKLLQSGELLERAKKNGIEVVSWSIFNEL